jgi:hypothetical protein
MIYDLVSRAQRKVPARYDANWDKPVQAHANAHPHLHFLGHRQFNALLSRHVDQRVAHGRTFTANTLTKKNNLIIRTKPFHSPAQFPVIGWVHRLTLAYLLRYAHCM